MPVPPPTLTRAPWEKAERLPELGPVRSVHPGLAVHAGQPPAFPPACCLPLGPSDVSGIDPACGLWMLTFLTQILLLPQDR